MLESHFRVEAQTHGPESVLALYGELDVASSGALEQELEAVSGSRRVLVDLRRLDFIDSTGLKVLVNAHQQAQDAGREFGIVHAAGQVQRLLELTGVSERLAIGDLPDELLSGG